MFCRCFQSRIMNVILLTIMVTAIISANSSPVPEGNDAKDGNSISTETPNASNDDLNLENDDSDDLEAEETFYPVVAVSYPIHGHHRRPYRQNSYGWRPYYGGPWGGQGGYWDVHAGLWGGHGGHWRGHGPHWGGHGGHWHW